MTLPAPADIQAFIRRMFPSEGEGDRIVVEQASPERAVVRLRSHPMHLRPGQSVHGPAQMALADTAAWVLILAARGLDAAPSVTSNLNISFLARPQPVDLLAEASLLKLSERSCVCEVRLFSEGSASVVAHATVSYAVRVAPGS
jgi:uncharacterized protein (TIGR00369 family)